MAIRPRKFEAILFLLAICGGGLLAGADERPGARIKGWGQVVDPDRDCSVAARDGALEIKIPGTPHDFAAELGIQNSPRVLRPVKGDFIAQVKVVGAFRPGETSKVEGRLAYHGAGLLAMKDENSYVGLHRACLNSGGQLRHYANFELREDGRLATSRGEIEIADGDTYLRLERRGNNLIGSTSPDGVRWTSYDPIPLKLPETIQVGVLGVSSADVPLVVKFEGPAIWQPVAGD